MVNEITRSSFEELLRQLIAVKSPYFHEDEVMDFVNEWLKERGVPAQIHTFFEPKETKFHGKNVIGIMDSGKPGPIIYLGGHLDTVQLCNGWTKPPYEGVIEGDDMYGVGALDMKSGCAADSCKICRGTSQRRQFQGQADISSRIGRRGTVRIGYGIYHK